MGSDWDLDGLLCAADSEHYSEHYFKVQNTDDGQKIYARGLAPEKGTADSGELYSSSTFLSVFSDFLDELNDVFGDVRFVGNNKEYARNIATKIAALKTKITETALIAAS